MAIFEDVTAALTAAMKARDTARVTALRNVRAGFIEALKTDNSTTLSDERCQDVLRRLAKMRAESIEAFTAGGRPEMAEAEKAELAVLQSFLPTLADEATTQAWAAAAIAAVGATSKKEMGKVMGVLGRDHKGAIDMGLARTVVERLLP